MGRSFISSKVDRPTPPPQVFLPSTNRLERSAQLREQFRALAAGDPKLAMATAKQLTNDLDRETALLSLVAEWTHGELTPPRQRAWAIANYGLEAGLGMALVKNPDLAVLWANEMTDGPARLALLQQTAIALLPSDPVAAFALSQQVAPNDQRQFANSVLAGWAGNDTEAALQWVGQLSDPADRDSGLQAIRTVAPVGIGAELATQQGYPVINNLIDGGSAALSGQLNKGDRIVGLAQGDGAFVDTREMSLQQVVQMIRGAPGTALQLQVIGADAPAGSSPRTVSLLRDQVKFKR